MASLFGSRRKPGWKHRLAGDRARDARNWPAAAAAYARYLTGEPNDWEIHVQLGHAHKESDDLPAAELSYRTAVELAAGEADPVFQLGALMQRVGRLEEAEGLYRRGQDLGSHEARRALEEILEYRVRLSQVSRRMPYRDHYRTLLANRPRQIWIGAEGGHGIESIDLKALPNFRAPAACHNRYQAVWLFEDLLSDMPNSQWPLLVDEAVRLIDEEGDLVVRHHQNDDFSLMILRTFLGRRPGITVTMEPHRVEETGIVNAVYRIRRDDIAEYRDSSWSFVILAQGSRTANVISILDQLKSIASTVNHEVIIVGPRLKEYSGYNVFVFNKDYREDYAQIALKKNEASTFASNANLCILHDRFILGDEFFSGFEKFGYDFDFVAVRQRYMTGEPYPFYAEQSGKPMVWSVPIHTLSYQHYRPTHFVNGGFMVFKRVMFDRIRFNPLLAWNEAEDVEISKAFAMNNIPPRINLLSAAVTTVGTEHTSMFLSDSGEVG